MTAKYALKFKYKYAINQGNKSQVFNNYVRISRILAVGIGQSGHISVLATGRHVDGVDGNKAAAVLAE